MNHLLWLAIVWLTYTRESDRQPDFRAVWKLKNIEEQSGKEVFSDRQYSYCWHNYPGVSMSLTLTSNQKATASVEFKDKKGNVAVVESPTWLTDNSDILDLAPSADGKSCVITAKGMVGSAKVTFVGDAKIGEGNTELRSTGEVFVQAGPATTVEMIFDTPVEQSDPVPVPVPVPVL